jgi:hypothetical protein
MAASNSIDELLTQLKASENLLTTKVDLLLTSKTTFESKMIDDLRKLNQKITELDLLNYVENKNSFKLQQQQLQIQTQALQTANTENTRLKSEIANNRQLIDEQTRQSEAIKTELNTQKGQVLKAIQEKKSLETINASIMAKNRELQPIIDNLKTEIQNLKTQLLELPGLKNGKEQLTQQINDLTQQLSKKTTDHETNSEQLLLNQQQIAALEGGKQRFEEEIQRLNNINKGLKAQGDRLVEENEELKRNQSMQKTDIEQAKQKIYEINQNLRQQIERIDVALIKNQNGEDVPDELIALIETIKQNLAIAVVKGGNKRKTKKMRKIKKNNMRRRSQKTNKKRNKSISKSKRGGWVYKSNERLDSQSSEITTNSNSNSNVKGEGIRKTKKGHGNSHYKSKAKSRSHKMQ